MDPALEELLIRGASNEDRIIDAIIRLRDPAAAIPGVQIIARFGSIATCRIAAKSVRDVRGHSNVISLKAARPLGPEPEAFTHLDHAAHEKHELRLSDVRRPPNLPLTGEGVVIGIVDFGIAVDYPSLTVPGLDGHNSTRFLSVWNQRAPRSENSPQPYGYGAVYTEEDINRAIRSGHPYRWLGYHPGPSAHGLHVTDIAAGNGRAGGPLGISPNSRLVFCELADATGALGTLGDSVRLLEAVSYVRGVAADAGLPWVINLSLGRISGSHDGKSLVEMAFDELLTNSSGGFICNSAGNYAKSKTHTSGILQTGEKAQFSFITSGADRTVNELEIWYSGSDEFVVRIDPPGNIKTQPVPLNQQRAIEVNGEVIGRIFHRRDPNNDDHHIDAFLSPNGYAGKWKVTLEAVHSSNGRYDAWIERDQKCSYCQPRFVDEDSDETSTTGTIANSHVPLVVGCQAEAPDAGAAPFSSFGPTRDKPGRNKPDLIAPGVKILAACSDPLSTEASTGRLTRKTGSSMATPVVTGCVSLVLQAGGLATRAEDVRQLVLSTATPISAAADWRRVGAGRLDVEALVAATRKAFPISSNVQDSEEPVVSQQENILHQQLVPASELFRSLLYEPKTNSDFAVLAGPGQSLAARLHVGDLLLKVPLGRAQSGGDSYVITNPTLSRRRSNQEGSPAGWYVEVKDATGSLSSKESLLLDPQGCVVPGQLVLRSRRCRCEERTAGGEPSLEEVAPVQLGRVDASLAIPSFSETERQKIITPLLSKEQLAKAVAWNDNMHPKVSGISLEKIGAALDSYSNPSSVEAAVAGQQAKNSSPSTQALLAERIHQFQSKCYSEQVMQDGFAGPSTLDSLGFMDRSQAWSNNSKGQSSKAEQRLRERNKEVKQATQGQSSAGNWFLQIMNPSVFGLTTKRGDGLHVELVRRIRQAERYLLTLPAYSGRTPAELGGLFSITERHGGARPHMEASLSMHTFGLAIDIERDRNPWVHSAESWEVLRRAALLIGQRELRGASAPEYFSSLTKEPTKSTAAIWDELKPRSSELHAYLSLEAAPDALRSALEKPINDGVRGLINENESLDQALLRWGKTIRQDRATLRKGDFSRQKNISGFLNLGKDLVVALRDHGCLAWGAVDLGPGKGGSGDFMHFDARINGAGRALTKNTRQAIATSHPCTSSSSTDAPAKISTPSLLGQEGAEESADAGGGKNVRVTGSTPGRRRCCALGQWNFPYNLTGALDSKKLNGHSYSKSGGPTGYVYTGVAGLMDLGHVRDLVDMTKFVFDGLAAGAERFELYEGTATLKRKPLPAEVLPLVAAISYVESWAHELATWGTTEDFSSFSPEDIPSNIVGIEVGIRALIVGRNFNASVDSQLASMLNDELKASTKIETEAVLKKIEGKGRWFVMSGAFPRVERRNFDGTTWPAGMSFDEPLSLPWLTPSAFTPTYSKFDYVMNTSVLGRSRNSLLDMGAATSAIRAEFVSRHPGMDRP